MCDCMTFPETVDEFMEEYKIVDTKQIYTNGTELVPIFRMKQWFDHLPSTLTVRHGHWIKDGHHITCDQCGQFMCDKDREGDPISQNFCPNCGARMNEVK